MIGDLGTTLTGVGTLLAGCGTLVTAYYTSRVHRQVKTRNGNTLGEIADELHDQATAAPEDTASAA